MRFFTTITPAGKGEYFIIALILNVILFVVAFRIFGLEVDIATQNVGYDASQLPLMAFVFVGYAGTMIINSMRRLKDAASATGMAFLTPIPVLGQLVQLMVAGAQDKAKAGFTPFGKDPYDPDAWVDNSPKKKKRKGGDGAAPAVSFRGQALMLPGEDRFDDAA